MGPREDYLPPAPPSDEEDEEDEPPVPLEPAATTEVAYGSREKVSLTEVAAMTELTVRAREKVAEGSKLSTKGDSFSTSKTGIAVPNLAGEAGADLGQTLARQRDLLEAKQTKWDRASLTAAKQFAVRSVDWYPRNPQWVPAFAHGPVKRTGGDFADGSHSMAEPRSKRTKIEKEGLFEEGIVLNQGKPFRW